MTDMSQPMSNQQVLAVYQAMAQLTAQMLQAAGQSDWERLEALEQRCARHVASLKQNEPLAALEGEGRQQKADLIKQMLADDRRIRDLTTPWMAHLSAMLSSASTQRRVVNAYGRV